MIRLTSISLISINTLLAIALFASSLGTHRQQALFTRTQQAIDDLLYASNDRTEITAAQSAFLLQHVQQRIETHNTMQWIALALLLSNAGLLVLVMTSLRRKSAPTSADPAANSHT